jgi:diguanylate cyclase (GGDEF)-like protein
MADIKNDFEYEGAHIANQELGKTKVGRDILSNELEGGVILDSYEERAKLKLESNTDHLTGLLNRRGFDTKLKESFEHALRTKEKVTIYFLDVDRFKEVNIKYSRLGGDEALKAFGAAVIDTFRKADSVARWGGDEFVVLSQTLKNSEPVNIDSIQERLNRNIEERKPENMSDEHLSVTLGVAVWDGISSYDEFQRKVQDHMDSRK